MDTNGAVSQIESPCAASLRKCLVRMVFRPLFARYLHVNACRKMGTFRYRASGAGNLVQDGTLLFCSRLAIVAAKGYVYWPCCVAQARILDEIIVEGPSEAPIRGFRDAVPAT